MACTARRHRATPRQRSRYTQAERELKKELITLESDLVGGPEVSTMAESEQHGRVLGDMLDLRKELMRTIASPWHPRMGRRRRAFLFVDRVGGVAAVPWHPQTGRDRAAVPASGLLVAPRRRRLRANTRGDGVMGVPGGPAAAGWQS